jgi:hypothetical protein
MSVFSILGDLENLSDDRYTKYFFIFSKTHSPIRRAKVVTLPSAEFQVRIGLSQVHATSGANLVHYFR